MNITAHNETPKHTVLIKPLSIMKLREEIKAAIDYLETTDIRGHCDQDTYNNIENYSGMLGAYWGILTVSPIRISKAVFDHIEDKYAETKDYIDGLKEEEKDMESED